MKLIITGELLLESQEIDISDTARIELRLPDGGSLRLHPRPATGSDYHSIEVMASSAAARGGLLLQPTASNVINFLIPASQEAADA